jgi:hypothetical protein
MTESAAADRANDVIDTRFRFLSERPTNLKQHLLAGSVDADTRRGSLDAHRRAERFRRSGGL